MKKKILPLIFVIAGLAAIAYFSWQDKVARDSIVESASAFPIMSTEAVFRFAGPPKETDKAVNEARKALEHAVEICSFFDRNSELARLNASAAEQPFRCSDELWELLMKTAEYHRLSNGAFDPTIRPLMRLWGFQMKKKELPSAEQIRETQKICGFSKIVFDPKKQTVFFPVKGLSIDLGGIAKGWAVDLAWQAVMKKTSVRSGLIDLGGNIRCLPQPPANRPFYRIGIRNPLKTDALCHAAILRNAAAATSGGYERFTVIQGKKYGHIIDPATGCPAEGNVLSATVIAPTAVEADALSTAFFIRGEKFFRILKSRKPAVRAFVVLRGKDGVLEYRELGPGWIDVKP